MVNEKYRETLKFQTPVKCLIVPCILYHVMLKEYKYSAIVILRRYAV